MLKLPLHPSLTTTIILPLNLQTSVGLSDDTKLALQWNTLEKETQPVPQDFYPCAAGDQHSQGTWEAKSTIKLNFMKQQSKVHCDHDNSSSLDIEKDFLSSSIFWVSFFIFFFLFVPFNLFSSLFFLLLFSF